MVVIIGRQYGQLGNQLLLLSHLFSGAVRNNYRVLAPALCDKSELFPQIRGLVSGFPALGPASPRLNRWVGRGGAALRYLPFIKEDGLIRAKGGVDVNSVEFAKAAREKVILIHCGSRYQFGPGLRQAPEQVRDLLAPRHDVFDEAHRWTSESRGNADYLVGVHVRRGDYKDAFGGRYFFSNKEYACAMQGVEEELGGSVEFMITSSAPDDAPRGHKKGPGTAINDLFALSQCDHILGPPSTFSGWASFFGNVPRSVMNSASNEMVVEEARTYNGDWP